MVKLGKDRSVVEIVDISLVKERGILRDSIILSILGS
jgi:hypothetical protein